MFEELWLIKNTMCYYYKGWTDFPIKVDNDLFSGFFVAFNSFQEEVFPNQFVNYIDFIDSRLLFLKFSDLFIIVRDVIQKPLNRSLLQLHNLGVEIISKIEINPELRSTLLTIGSSPTTSVESIAQLLNPIIDDSINTLVSTGSTMNRFDLLAIILILREFNECLSMVVNSNLFTLFRSNNPMDWLFKFTINDKPINPDEFPLISYNILISFIKSYFNYIAKNMSKYKLSLTNEQRLEFCNKLNKFFVVNREALTKFRVTDLFISKFLGNIAY